jgi:hypothetical protein
MNNAMQETRYTPNVYPVIVIVVHAWSVSQIKGYIRITNFVCVSMGIHVVVFWVMHNPVSHGPAQRRIRGQSIAGLKPFSNAWAAETLFVHLQGSLQRFCNSSAFEH